MKNKLVKSIVAVITILLLIAIFTNITYASTTITPR